MTGSSTDGGEVIAQDGPSPAQPASPHPGVRSPAENPPAPDADFRFAAEVGKMGLWALDLANGIMSASASFKALLGAGPDAALSWPEFEQLVHPADRERQMAALHAAIAGDADYDIEHRILPPDGSQGGVIWMHFRARLERRPDGSPSRLAGVAFDVTDRRHAEMRLELSEESLRLAADAGGLGIWDFDLTTQSLTWSDRTCAIFGIEAGAHVTLDDFYAGLHPDDLKATQAAFESAVDPAIRATYDVEYRTVGRRDGVIRWAAARGRGLFMDGKCHRAIGTVMDITARKSAFLRQEFLLNLMDRLRNLSDPAALMDTAVRALGEFTGACRVGYGQVQPDQKTIVLETCHADGVAPLTGVFQLDSFGAHTIGRQRQGQTVVVDDTGAGPFGDPARWAAIGTRAFVSVPLVRDGAFRASLFVNRAQPYAWPEAEIKLIETVARRIWDALERARAENELRQLNALLQGQVSKRTRALDRTWRTAPVFMVVGDATTGTLLDVNPAWTAGLGWKAEESVGHDVMEFTAPEDRAGAAAGMEILFQGLPVIDYPVTFLTKDGHRRRIAWTTVPDNGRLYGYGRDVTDQVAAEEKLLQSQKMEAVGQLTGGLAHDFNNMLTGIIGGLEVLQTRIAQGRIDQLGRYIDIAQGAAQRAAALTQRLLAFSRRQTLDPKPVCINLLVTGMQDLIASTVGPSLPVDIDLAPGLPLTLVDPHQLENALLNLCINARDAMPQGGRIAIRTARKTLAGQAALDAELPPGQYVALTVSDTGTGMSPEVMRRAFDPFFTTKPLGAGTGLGLSMIYGFARQSGGQVRIMSAPGQGTTVKLTLPLHVGARPPASASRAADSAPQTGHGRTVLVVDDEAAIRMLVREVLEDFGYATIEAHDGAAGLKILESGARVDILVTDVGLPGGMNGRQLADFARRARPALPVLFITGYAEAAILGNGDLAPGMQVMIKPFAMDTLAVRLRELTGS